MPCIHIANTNFEWEISSRNALPLAEGLKQHPVFLQLQFLPLLYAKEEDAVVVTDLPPEDYWKGKKGPKIYTFNDAIPAKYGALSYWGASLSVKKWAESKKIACDIPPLEIVEEVHSKAFCQNFAPQDAMVLLLKSKQDLQKWLQESPFPKVLKKIYAHAGRGHLLLLKPSSNLMEKTLKFCRHEWEKGFPVRAELWLTRIFDFSTQWEIHKEGRISLIGATVFENSSKGAYQRTFVGDERVFFQEHLHFLEEHKQKARPLLEKIRELGYYGNLGLDAFLYKNGNEILLYPVTEINARKTMSWAGIAWQKAHHKGRNFSFSYLPMKGEVAGLLPTHIQDKGGTKTPFTFQLQAQAYPFSA